MQLLGATLSIGRPSGYVDPGKAAAAATVAAEALARFQVAVVLCIVSFVQLCAAAGAHAFWAVCASCELLAARHCALSRWHMQTRRQQPEAPCLRNATGRQEPAAPEHTGRRNPGAMEAQMALACAPARLNPADAHLLRCHRDVLLCRRNLRRCASKAGRLLKRAQRYVGLLLSDCITRSKRKLITPALKCCCMLPWHQPPQFALHLPALQSEETCYIQVTGMVTADVLESDQEYDDVSRAGVGQFTCFCLLPDFDRTKVRSGECCVACLFQRCCAFAVICLFISASALHPLFMLSCWSLRAPAGAG